MRMVAAGKMLELGAQFALLGGWALVCGGVRLWFAERTRRRFVLMVGLVFFALGLTAQSLLQLKIVDLNYHPGREAGMNHVPGVVHARHAYADDDPEATPGDPRGWEGGYWWGQRFFLLLGALAAGVGFLCEDRRGRKEVRS